MPSCAVTKIGPYWQMTEKDLLLVAGVPASAIRRSVLARQLRLGYGNHNSMPLAKS